MIGSAPTRLAHAVVLAWGWQRAALAFAAGAFSVLAMAPFHAWPVLFLTLPLVVWLIDGAGAGRLGGIPAAALTGWWFGFGYFLAGLYWLGHAFLVDAATFGWLLPLGVAGLPAGLAFFMALGFGLARWMWLRGPWRIVALAAALSATEWLRGHILSGFPWNAFGNAFAEPLALAQTASLGGLWLLTLLVLLIGASPATLTDDAEDTPRPWLAPLLGLGALIVMSAYGFVRLNDHPTRFVDAIRLRIMQPNLQQDEKFNYSARQSIMRRYIALSERTGAPSSRGLRDTTLLIWPESAFPFFLAREAEAMAQIAEMLPKDTILITGAVRPPETAPGQRTTRAYNSIYAIDHTGTILSVYDKLHLVPFGEYLPFQNAMEQLGFQQLTKLHGGYIPGDRRRNISLPRIPSLLPLICYEVIFPGEITARDARPRWIVNVTNDAWFGTSTGPYQHLQQARLRAIEEGLPIVRAANTGISAVIDPAGRVTAQLELGVEGVLDAALPEASPPTVYNRFGDGIFAILLALCGIMLWRRRLRG